jgi:hypothetical protein
LVVRVVRPLAREALSNFRVVLELLATQTAVLSLFVAGLRTEAVQTVPYPLEPQIPRQ